MEPSSLVGASIKRKEDGRLLRGGGRYVDDLVMPGMLCAGLVRSLHAHARIRRVEGSAALKVPRVVAVLTLADLPDLAASVPPLVPERHFPPYRHPVLAGATTRYAGEIIAIVLAEDAYAAADGVEAVVVDYEPLPAAVTVAEALAPSAPRVHEDWPGNVCSTTVGGCGDIDAGFAAADVIVEGRFRYPRVAGMPIEGRGVLAAPDATGARLTVWSSTQVPYAVRTAVAGVLSMAEAHVRVIAPEVGGGFGVKGHVYPEEMLVPAAARHVRRPVKWVETRREHLLTAAADRDQRHHARLGLRTDGTIVALETEFTRDHGAAPTLGEAITMNTINHLPGPYRVPNYRGTGRNVVTHKTFAAAYRGAGRPEAAFVLDRLLDRAARRLDMDPAELRRRNMIRAGEMPFRSGLTYRDGVPITYDPADYVAAFDRALERVGYAAWRDEQKRRRHAQRPIGIGLCAYVEGTGLGPFEGADITVDPSSGTVFVHIGVSAQGQGHETVFAQICADRLGVTVDDVAVVGGDTQVIGYGMGTIASRVAAVAGPAVARAALDVAAKARLVAAELLECAADDLLLAGGRVHVKGMPDRSVRLKDVARAAVRSPALSRTSGPGLSACAFFYPGSVTWAFGVQAVVVEVEVETGAVAVLRHVAMHDCGTPINPMIVEGQLHGGMAQGLGSALLESLVYDGAGQLLTGTLMDYALPRAADMPAFEVDHLDFPSIVNPLGIKGVGESGVIAPAAAVANAVEDALAPWGVQVDQVPLTSGRIIDWLASARSAAAALHPSRGREGTS
ncbi:MAG TPA: xanthine dehydrogenase family protein molybdopterin-binding subunit [Candidatus Limnocylindria bacterium]|nr:xanthine dehydrogenase family protein molybdopterin-binding subunit [Candidatus Limnocylindria bacterium]